MPKETTEEKIAKSSGNDTEKYAQELEDDVDDLINKTYHPDKIEDDKKKAEEEEAKKAEEEKKKTEEEEKEDPEKAEAEKKEAERIEAEEKEKEKEEISSIEIKDGETVESIKEKADKRIKETQAKMTRATQDSAASKKEAEAAGMLIETLQTTITSLQEQLKTLPKGEHKKEETEKKTIPLLQNIEKEMEKINKLDSEMGAPIKNIINGLVDSVNDLSTKLTEKTKAVEQRQLENDEDAHYAIIEKAHPDWETIYGSEVFTNWINELSPRQKNLAHMDLKNGTAENIVELMTDYKTATGLIKEETDELPDNDKDIKSKEKIESAKKIANPTFKKVKEVKTKAPIKYTRSMIKNMSDGEYAEKEKDIDKEMAAGRIANE